MRRVPLDSANIAKLRGVISYGNGEVYRSTGGLTASTVAGITRTQDRDIGLTR